MTATIAMSGRLEPRDGWEARACAAAATLDVVRSKSTFLVLRELFYGAERFEQIARRTGLSEPIVSARLRELSDEELLERSDYKEVGQRTRQRYGLTRKGEDFFPVLVALMGWGDRWAQDAARVELRHSGCGAVAHAEVRCTEGHAVGPGDLELAERSRHRQVSGTS